MCTYDNFWHKFLIFFSYIFQLQASKKSTSAEDSPTSKQQTSQADLHSQVINNGGGLRKGGFSSTPDLKSFSTNVPLIPLEELKVKIGVKTSAKTDLDLTLHHYMQVRISGYHFFWYPDTWIPWINGYHGYKILIFWILGLLDIKDIILFWILPGYLDTMNINCLHYPENW